MTTEWREPQRVDLATAEQAAAIARGAGFDVLAGDVRTTLSLAWDQRGKHGALLTGIVAALAAGVRVRVNPDTGSLWPDGVDGVIDLAWVL